MGQVPEESSHPEIICICSRRKCTHAVTAFSCIDITVPCFCVALCSFQSTFKSISSFYPLRQSCEEAGIVHLNLQMNRLSEVI